MSEINVSELNIYPVKSLRQISLSSSKVEAFGLQNDRRWMVVDQDGIMLTQRQKNRMCLVQPELTREGIKLFAETMPDIVIVKPLGESRKSRVKVWNDECHAYDAGDDAAQWLSDFLAFNCRLVYFPDDEFRQVDPEYARSGERTAFSDGFPLLLTSQASLDDLNARLEKPVPMKRFRPNLVVSGSNAFEEDNWKKLRVGEVIFRVVKPCSRCIIPNIDIETAKISDEPARTLATYRRIGNNIFFGQNLIAENEGKISVDMPIDIIS